VSGLNIGDNGGGDGNINERILVICWGEKSILRYLFIRLAIITVLTVTGYSEKWKRWAL
jgi:hypothetical protein